MKSKIFTGAELNSLNNRLKGSKKDDTGIYSARVKPKIIELLSHWFPMYRQLKKLVENGKK